ncbi:MAG: hypothetical protein F4Z41_00465 [Acidimicrobiia bacterium]|nr:hypothetical protein [Acidimicrobiia bacterium]
MTRDNSRGSIPAPPVMATPSCGMMWFAPRPYLKWAGAAAIVGVSWLIQLIPSPVTLHPFATMDIPAGAELSEELFEYREIPEGLLPAAAAHGILAVSLSRGDPLTPAVLAGADAGVPDGWWALELETPPGLFAGSQVLLVAGGDEPAPAAGPIPGIVIRPMADGREPGERALIAVPGEQLARVSTASAYGTLTVAVAAGR